MYSNIAKGSPCLKENISCMALVSLFSIIDIIQYYWQSDVDVIKISKFIVMKLPISHNFFLHQSPGSNNPITLGEIMLNVNEKSKVFKTAHILQAHNWFFKTSNCICICISPFYQKQVLYTLNRKINMSCGHFFGPKNSSSGLKIKIFMHGSLPFFQNPDHLWQISHYLPD